MRKPMDADIWSTELGINLKNEPPSNTPINDAKTRAKEDPRKTAIGLLLVPLIAIVAI